MAQRSTRRSQNPLWEEVFQDCLTKWEESVAHSILARSLLTPPKAVYICADQPRPSFRLQLGGGPYIPRIGLLDYRGDNSACAVSRSEHRQCAGTLDILPGTSRGRSPALTQSC